MSKAQSGLPQCLHPYMIRFGEDVINPILDAEDQEGHRGNSPQPSLPSVFSSLAEPSVHVGQGSPASYVSSQEAGDRTQADNPVATQSATIPRYLLPSPYPLTRRPSPINSDPVFHVSRPPTRTAVRESLPRAPSAYTPELQNSQSIRADVQEAEAGPSTFTFPNYRFHDGHLRDRFGRQNEHPSDIENGQGHPPTYQQGTQEHRYPSAGLLHRTDDHYPFEFRYTETLVPGSLDESCYGNTWAGFSHRPLSAARLEPRPIVPRDEIWSIRPTGTSNTPGSEIGIPSASKTPEVASEDGGEVSVSDPKGKRPRTEYRPHLVRRPRGVRKTEVACNFCRGRKLRCDGLRPSCYNCTARSKDCQYVDKPRRRGPGRAPKGSKSKKATEDCLPSVSYSPPPEDTNQGPPLISYDPSPVFGGAGTEENVEYSADVESPSPCTAMPDDAGRTQARKRMRDHKPRSA